MIVVAGPFHMGARRLQNPSFGNDLPISPSSTLQKELPKFRHVTRAQLEVAPPVIVTATVGGPHNIVDAERHEQFLACEGQSVRARGLSYDGGQQVTVAAAVRPPRAGLVNHRQVEHELGPIRAASHLEKPRLVRLEATVPARLHGEQVLERQRPLARVQCRDRARRKKAQHGLVHIAEVPLFDREADQRGSDALRH